MILSDFNNSDETKGKKIKCMIIDTLLQYEGLLTSIVQWGFWEEKYRPDITKELKDNVSDVVELGKTTLIRLISATDLNSEEGRKRLETIGTTPIISKEYDPECKISFVVELIRLIKIEGWTMDVYEALRRLTIWGSCVDKDVITELIDLGINTNDDRWVVHVAVLLHYMILKDYTDRLFYSDDTRAAFAIRSGLIELCLTFIERFGLNESFDDKMNYGVDSLFASIKSIFDNIYWIGLHKKTAKAIRSQRCDIEQELARLEQNADIANNVNCKRLLDVVRSILGINGSYCCRCNKSLGRTDVKLCNGCHRMSYCSRACQREDWFGGHSITCCKPCTDANVGQFQGRYEPGILPEDERAATKLTELEINMSIIQLKLFLDHSETILSQASSLDIPLCDCVVRFDLRECPLEVVTRKYNDFADTPERKRGFEDSRSKDNIACIFLSNIYDGSSVEGQIQMQRLFPHEWLSKEKAQEIDNVDDY